MKVQTELGLAAAPSGPRLNLAYAAYLRFQARPGFTRGERKVSRYNEYILGFALHFKVPTPARGQNKRDTPGPPQNSRWRARNRETARNRAKPCETDRETANCLNPAC